MTSINAMRFDDHSGVLVCDEGRCWNPEQMAFFTPEKIRNIIRPDIQRDIGIVICMGNTGTSTLGDEFIEATKNRISDDYDAEVKRLGKKPARFKTVEETAHLAYDVITRIKHRQIDNELKGKFGFTTADYVRGSYKKDDKEIEIKEKEVIGTVHKYITWEGRAEEVTGVFLNAQVLAGYDPQSGFRIFYLSEITPICEAVQEIFLAEGSGLDICDLMFSDYARTRSIPERRGSIDRVEGLVAMLEGLNAACRLSAGVAGYLKIMYIDGREKDPAKRYKEMSDRRSKLASEIVLAGSHGLIPKDRALRLVDDIVYQDKPFAEVDAKMWQATPDRNRLFRFFRGYPG